MGLFSFRSLLLAWRENTEDLTRARRWRRLSLVLWLMCIAGLYVLMTLAIWSVFQAFPDNVTSDSQVAWSLSGIGIVDLTLLQSIMLMPESIFLRESHWRKIARALRRSLRARSASMPSGYRVATVLPDAPSVANIPAHGTYHVVEPQFAWIEEERAFVWFFSSWIMLPLGLLLAALAYVANLPGGWMGLPPTPQSVHPLLLASAFLIAMGMRTLVAGMLDIRRRAAQRRGFAITAGELGLTFRQPVWSRSECCILWTEIKSLASFPYADSLISIAVAREPEQIIYLLDGGANRLMWELPLQADNKPRLSALDGRDLAALIVRHTGLPLLDLNEMMLEIAKRGGNTEDRLFDEAQAVALIESDSALAQEVERARGHITPKIAEETNKRVEKIAERWLALLRDSRKAPKGNAAIQSAGWQARALLPYYPTESPLVEGRPVDVYIERMGAWLRRKYLWLVFTPVIAMSALALFLSIFPYL